jgi:hypothetical protein
VVYRSKDYRNTSTYFKQKKKEKVKLAAIGLIVLGEWQISYSFGTHLVIRRKNGGKKARSPDGVDDRGFR